MSLKRIHVLDTDTPIQEGVDTAANCGFVVPKAVADRLTAYLKVGAMNEQFCRKCLTVSMSLAVLRHYCYGLIPGEDSVPGQVSEEA